MISLPNVMIELQDFNLISNFKINYSKSEILPLNISMDLRAGLQSSFSYTWCNTFLKYLGIHLLLQRIVFQRILDSHYGASAKLWVPLWKFLVGRNLACALGEHLSFFCSRPFDRETRCDRFVQDQGLLNLDALRDRYGRFPMDDWCQRQLRPFISSLPQAIRSPLFATPFEKLCMSTSVILLSISVLYGMLESLEPRRKPLYLREWERDLQHEFTKL